MPFAVTWMEQEIIIFSEISQKEKDKCHIIYPLYVESKIWHKWSSHCGSAVKNPTSIHEYASLIPGPAQWVKDLALS